MRPAAIAIVLGVLLAGCGGSGGGGGTTAATAGPPAGPVAPPGTSADPEGPAAAEANPESPAVGPEPSGELPAADRSAVGKAVAAYIAALNRHDAAAVCRLLEGCAGALHATIGATPPDGGPAWRRSRLASVRVERLGDDRARVSATVVHQFSDRKYVSVEDDVVYLERAGGRWLLAKPSGTFYRATGHSEPPLRSLRPPAGW